MTSELEWRRRWRSTLSSTPWKLLTVSGNALLIKFYAHHRTNSYDYVYEFLMTDQSNLWYEELSETLIQKRAKKLNPGVEAPISKLLSHIEQQLEEQPSGTKYEFGIGDEGEDREENKTRLSFTSRLAGLPFNWTFKPSRALSSMLSEHVFVPFLTIIQEQQRRENELFKILSAKDREIEDLRVQGAKSSRRHLETGLFDETAFRNSMDTSEGFEESVLDNGTSAFGTTVRDLYKKIVTKKAWVSRSPDEDLEGESVAEGDSIPADNGSGATGQSWANRIPGSIVGASSSSTSNSPTKSPAKSPAKTPDPSPSKDTELLRRQALERRLQEEESKKDHSKAKKKKKIKF